MVLCWLAAHAVGANFTTLVPHRMGEHGSGKSKKLPCRLTVNL